MLPETTAALNKVEILVSASLANLAPDEQRAFLGQLNRSVRQWKEEAGMSDKILPAQKRILSAITGELEKLELSDQRDLLEQVTGDIEDMLSQIEEQEEEEKPKP